MAAGDFGGDGGAPSALLCWLAFLAKSWGWELGVALALSGVTVTNRTTDTEPDMTGRTMTPVHSLARGSSVV